MAALSITTVITSPVPPHRLFKGLILERHVTVPKLMPQVFKSIEIIQGDGGVGTIKKTTIAEGHPFKYMFHRIDELDVVNSYCKYTLFDGDVLGDNKESITYETKCEPKDKGSIAKLSSHFHPKPGAKIEEEELKVSKEKAEELFKNVEGYLLSHPDVYA